MTALLDVQDLVKQFPTRHGVVQAVDHVSFSVAPGKTVALVGESGCGKSTVALSLLDLIKADGGTIAFEGIDLAGLSKAERHELRRRMSIVFQNPYSSLDPKMRIRDIVGEPLKAAFGLRGKRMREKVAQYLSDVGLTAEHMNRYPHEFSGGQRQRIAVARALALEPKLLVLDEPTAALDVSVQAQVLNLLRNLQRRLGLGYLFISHNLAVVEFIADEVMVMYLGRIVESGPVARVFAAPAHPYTRALLDSVPSIDPNERDRLKPLTGEVPSPLNRPAGCAFAQRCPLAADRCRSTIPENVPVDGDGYVACFTPLNQGKPQ